MLFQMFYSRYFFVFSALSCVFGYEDDARIVGGKRAHLGKFPYKASLQVNDKHICGGSIISRRWILTAAHCVILDNKISVLVGTVTLDKGGDRYPIIKAIPHKGTRRQHALNDIALLKTESEIEFSEYVSPIALGVEKVLGGVEVLLSGWGLNISPSLPQTQEMQNDLLYIKSRTITNEECLEAASKGQVASINPEHICTFHRHGAGMCFGDTGGALANKDNYKLIGIATRILGIGKCAVGLPDVHTRVSSFID